MKYLNLTPGFTPLGELNALEFETFTFSGGEPHIKIKYEREHDHEDEMDVQISIRITSYNDLGLLAMAVDALRRLYPIKNLHLFLPYVPGARQDRVCNAGEALTIKVYADAINAMGFQFVDIFDPHSDVAPALINNCIVHNNHDFVEYVMERTFILANYTLISPDAGAGKKVVSLAGSLSRVFRVVKCDKTRELSTGKLSGFEVYTPNLEGETCVIVDDICDGGGTFVGLAEKLREKGAKKLYLVVSHGIFSRGLQKGLEIFDGIACSNSFAHSENEHLEVIKFNRFL